jgi:hypothetical protein
MADAKINGADALRAALLVNYRAKAIEKQAAEPPPYSSKRPSAQTSSLDVETEANPELHPVFDKLDFTPSPLELPSTAECIVHLKLLHAFAKLRHNVGNQDGIFGINLEKGEDIKEEVPEGGASHQPNGVHAHSKTKGTGSAHPPIEEQKAAAALGERIREKRWSVFVTKAVDRFEKWWNSLSSKANPDFLPLTTDDFESTPNNNLPFQYHLPGLEGWGSRILPPLDILMVWHSYLLNPRVYFEDCVRLSRQELWRTPFPWKAIHEAIDNETYVYTVPKEATDTFKESPGISWYSQDDDQQKSILCPKCLNSVQVPWTRPPFTNGPESIESYLDNDTGFASPHFQEACPQCNFMITHEKLRVGKFISDVKALSLLKRPLPGTILNFLGCPQTISKGKHLGTHDPFFPNRLVEKLPEFSHHALQNNIENLSIEQLKSMIEGVMQTKSKGKIQIVNSEQYKTGMLARESKIAIRKMLSHYWENSSVFGLDLVGAVLRQGTFVLKMRKIDWLHSPTAMTTMQRLIVKYHRFIRIIADNPGKLAVPTLDVDLAWVSSHLFLPSPLSVLLY